MGNVATRFEWDAENRLTAAYPASPRTGDQKVEFRYDYLNRRIQKKVFDWTASGWSSTPSLERRYVWAGHLLLMELDGNNQPVRKYTWGLDLAGQSGQVNSLEGAGGIGGLLAVYDLNDTPGAEQTGDDLQYIYAYDGNGNVVQVLDWSASSATAAIVAKYEYDPYGNVVAQAGDYAERNPIRFSTKQWDDETGFGYWEQRYYSPRLGRWMSEDPYSELGWPANRSGAGRAGVAWRSGSLGRIVSDNRYEFVLNNPLGWVDPDGLAALKTEPPTTQESKTCVIQLRCGTDLFLGQRHCEYQIASSAGGGGTCTCGPMSCPAGWIYKCCRSGCLGCQWTPSRGEGSGGYGTVVAQATYPESYCDCLRRKCAANKPDVCYNVLLFNSNTAAGILNGACKLGFDRPGGAWGWISEELLDGSAGCTK